MAKRQFLAFDLGAESGRALVGMLEGQRLTLAEQHRFANPSGRIGCHLHWNLMGQWEELKTGLRKAAANLGGSTIHGIGVDTWGVDFGLVASNGEVLGNPFHYRDSRTDGMMERAFARVSKEEIFQATGIQFMKLNTLYQFLALSTSGSPLLEIAQTMLFMPDLFNYLFTGQRVSEFSIASTSQMYDAGKKAWANEMLERLDLPTRLLSKVVPSGTVIGPLLGDVAQECGIDASIPVIAPGCHDTASAVAAVPATAGRDWCYISSGTWSLMGVEIDSPIVNEKALRYNYTNEGGVGGKIRFLRNIMGMWLVQECRRQWQKEGREYSYADLAKLASDASAFGSVVDPEYEPFMLPGDMPAKIERFCRESKQKAPASPGEFVRSCLESLCLTYRRTLEGLEDVLGRRIETIHIVGGGSQNELLNQMVADACGRAVVAGPVEATAIGNILVQAMAVGEIKSLAAAREIVASSFSVKRYEPHPSRQWDDAYTRYRGVLAAT